LLPPLPEAKTHNNTKYHTGDRVRITGEITLMTRGYAERWNSTVYVIRETLHNRTVPVYRLKEESSDETIMGIFYDNELSYA
jgi:hypothetical protein